MFWQRGQHLGRRKRYMQEKSDPVGAASPPQGVCDGNQVIVMDPDQIIILDNFFELRREMSIDSEIAAEIPKCEFGEIQPIMQNRPQDAIGKAVVIFLIVVFRQICDNKFDIFVFEGARSQLVSRSDFAAPSEPDAAIMLERRS